MNYRAVIISGLAWVSSLAMAEQFPLQTLSLGTRAGLNLGLQLESYSYKEPRVMKQEGALIGIDLEWTALWESDFFSKTQFAYLIGAADYTGSGTLSATPVSKMEFRLVVGRDIQLDGGVLAPYVGLGCRGLYNDARGISSTGKMGYRRTNATIYLPLGIDYIATTSEYRSIWNLEFDVFLAGRQESMLQDAGYSQVGNDQYSGYGVRGGYTIERGTWSFGPYFQYWNIDDSEIIRAGPYSLVEPENRTLEFGLELKYHF